VQYGTFEYIVVTTKNVRDIFKVEDFVAPLVSEPSTIVLIQNGVDIGADVNF
jgi:ketopantoate reductase